MIIAIDPGPTESAFVLFDGDKHAMSKRTWKDEAFSKRPNAYVLDMVRVRAKYGDPHDVLVIEMIASYGMPVGREVFDTCVWSGRFAEAWHFETLRDAVTITRPAVKLQICGSMRAKDGNVRAALIDRFGGKERAIGKKKTPGPLYGVSGDVWAALAVAVTYAERTAWANREAA